LQPGGGRGQTARQSVERKEGGQRSVTKSSAGLRGVSRGKEVGKDGPQGGLCGGEGRGQKI